MQIAHSATWKLPHLVHVASPCNQRLGISWALQPVLGATSIAVVGRLNRKLKAGGARQLHSVQMNCETSSAGELFLYDHNLGYAAFEADRLEGSKALVCVGGLTDGLLSLRYLPSLAKALKALGWRTFQPVLQSSYRGWGFGSLQDDAEGLDKLLSFLETNRGISKVVVLGSSTGCQDAVHFLKVGMKKSLVHGIVLQAPVSDREALLAEQRSEDELAQLEKFKQVASQMISEGKGSEVLPRSACQLFGPPDVITAYRFDSLTRRMADDDMFSSDLTESELREKLGHVNVPCLLAISADDEYVPPFVDSTALCHRMANAMAAFPANSTRSVILPNGGHGVRSPEGQAQFIDAVTDFVSDLDQKLLRRLDWETALAADLQDRAAACGDRPLLVALAGMPGAGKSTTSQVLRRLLHPKCFVVPLDGFHVPLQSLRSRPAGDDAVYRRGAADTFDPDGLCEKLRQVAEGQEPKVFFPDFDHAIGDPVDDVLCFERSLHRIVLVEGLYLLQQQDGWGSLAALFDYKIYLEADLEESIARVKERNKAIPGYTPEEIDRRCDVVDRANAKVVQESANQADFIVQTGLDKASR
eukprot:s873_g38.t1